VICRLGGKFRGRKWEGRSSVREGRGERGESEDSMVLRRSSGCFHGARASCEGCGV
jgi:hypothetical protein